MKLGSILTLVTLATVSVAGAGIAGAFNKEENKSLGEGKQTGLEIGEQGDSGGEEEEEGEGEEADNKHSLEANISEITKKTKQKCREKGLNWIEIGNWKTCGHENSISNPVFGKGLTPPDPTFFSEESEEL